MERKTTIYDIAQHLGISAATVSRALNGNTKISEAVRSQVLEAASQMGYEQNKLAVALKSGRSNSVGIIVPRIDRNFFANVIRGVEEELAPHGYHVVITQSDDTADKERSCISTLLNAQVDGILMSVSNSHNDLEALLGGVRKKGIPIIFFDRRRDISGISTVTINDYEGGYLATRHLIDNGCQRIAHLAGDCSLEIYAERSRGYRQALIDAHLEPAERYIIQSQSKVEDGIEATRRLLKMRPAPDAIFSASDFAALGAIQELTARGIRVPNDFCVVGFSNEPFTRLTNPSISSVDQFPLDMGHIAARVFLQQIKDEGKTRFDQKVVLAPKLHIRQSSQRARQ